MARRKVTHAQVTVTGLDEHGYGTASVGSKPLRVRNALPDEHVEARVLRKRKGQLFADALSITQTHPQRTSSACQYFPRCGGCAMHHMQTDLQLQLKQQQLAHALQTAGVEVFQWREPTRLAGGGYRRKARLGVRQVGEQVLVGFRESFSNRVARIDHCEVLTPQLSGLIAPLKETIARLSQAAAIPQVEVAQGDHAVSIIVRHLTPLEPNDLAIWHEFETQHGVQVLLQAKGYDTIQRLSAEQGVSLLSYEIPAYSLTLLFYPWQFTQVNAAMNLMLIERALDYLQPCHGQHIIDLFCGLGNFSLPLAAAGAHVSGYELAQDAIQQAQHNSSNNRLSDRTRFYVSDLYESPPQDVPQANALLLDPPRSGAGPYLEHWIQASRCRRVVYVSCQPQSFAGDAALLNRLGFRLQEVGIYDMFPHTAHVETIGWFERADG